MNVQYVVFNVNLMTGLNKKQRCSDNIVRVRTTNSADIGDDQKIGESWKQHAEGFCRVVE